MVSVEFANLEMFLGQMLSALLDIPDHLGEIIYLTPKATMGRLEILENVIHDTLVADTEGLRLAENIIKRAKSAIQKRHTMIHVAWVVTETTPEEVHHIQLPIKEKTVSTPVPITSLTGFVRQIRKLSEDVRCITQMIKKSRRSTLRPKSL